MTHTEVETKFPGIATRLAGMKEIALVMTRDGDADVLRGSGRDLSAYDDPTILRSQLSRLNSFASCGDLVLFGAFVEGRQVNFENQAGGHGSIGGEQLHPSVLAKKEWGLDTSRVNGAHELHPILSDLRDRLAT